jgi:hypothetical protein
MVTPTLVVKEDIILKTQASIASVAYRDITGALQNPPPLDIESLVLPSVISDAIAEVSKILWPGNSGEYSAQE